VQAARAIHLVKRAVNAAPPVARYRHSLGLLLEKSGQLAAAADALEAACAKDKGNVKVSCF
jgi:lipopolysaccharide biosynthesis regulator YciM